MLSLLVKPGGEAAIVALRSDAVLSCKDATRADEGTRADATVAPLELAVRDKREFVIAELIPIVLSVNPARVVVFMTRLAWSMMVLFGMMASSVA